MNNQTNIVLWSVCLCWWHISVTDRTRMMVSPKWRLYSTSKFHAKFKGHVTSWLRGIQHSSNLSLWKRHTHHHYYDYYYILLSVMKSASHNSRWSLFPKGKAGWIRDPQQPGSQVTLEFRIKLTGAAKAALWTNHESHSAVSFLSMCMEPSLHLSQQPARCP